MATFSITTTTEMDQVVTVRANEYNARQKNLNPGWVNLTPVQYARDIIILPQLQVVVDQYNSEQKVSKAQAYQNLVNSTAPGAAQDKATIDTILAKYGA